MVSEGDHGGASWLMGQEGGERERERERETGEEKERAETRFGRVGRR